MHRKEWFAMPQFHKQLLDIQKHIYNKNMRIIKDSLSGDTHIAAYARQYKQYLKSYQSISSKKELVRKIAASQIVFHGDYHSLKQSQKCIYSLVKDVLKKRPLMLCLEMFYTEKQQFLDKYLAGKIDEFTFLKKIDYAKNWEYKWDYRKPLISLCRENNIPIIGINTVPTGDRTSIRKRDENAAKVIARTVLQNPDKLVYVVDGDYHISPNHLPAQVEKYLAMLDVFPRKTIVYQNADNLYWQLAEKQLEESDVLQISSDSFCIMNTTPANKLQSFINWLEYSGDAYYPVNSNWEEMAEVSDETTIPHLVETIASVLDLTIPPEAFDRLTVYYAANLNFISIVHNTEELRPIMPFVKKKITNNEGFLLHYNRNDIDNYLIYLANSSINMASEEAAHFINIVLRGQPRQNMSAFDQFYFNSITEALGYFGSKLINGKRCCLSTHRLRTFLGQFKNRFPTKSEKEKIQVARHILRHHYLEKQQAAAGDFQHKLAELYTKRKSVYEILATQLGYMLGSRMYDAARANQFSLDKIRQLFYSCLDAPGEAFAAYMEIATELRKLRSARKKAA